MDQGKRGGVPGFIQTRTKPVNYVYSKLKALAVNNFIFYYYILSLCTEYFIMMTRV